MTPHDATTVAEADDAMRERLAAALANFFGIEVGPLDLRAADALLPTVRAIVADELRAAAEDLPDSAMVSDYDRRNGATRPDARDWLRARADEMDPR